MSKRNDNPLQLIRDHWQGQFSHGAAFWGIALLSILAIKTFGTLLAVFNVIQDQVLSTRLWLLFAALALLVWLPWALIGALRSILLHIRKLDQAGAGVWLLACWLLALSYSVLEIHRAWPVFQRMAAIAFHEPEPRPELLVVDDQLYVSGEFSYGSGRLFKRTVAANPQLSTVHFDVTGGHLHDARQIAQNIARRQLNTHVSERCYGNCMLAYVGGYYRTAVADADFKFYEYLNYFNGYRSDWLIHREQVKDQEYFKQRGVSVALSYQLYYGQTNHEAFSPSTAELRSGNFVNAN